MNPVLSRLRAEIGDASVERCNKDQCSLLLDGLHRDSRVIMDCDEYAPVAEQRRCDYVVFYDDGRVHTAPVEFKSRNVKAQAVFEQLQAGADIAVTLTLAGEVHDCLPVLLHRGGIRGPERRRIDKLHVRFRGQECPVYVARCGSQLTSVVRS